MIDIGSRKQPRLSVADPDLKPSGDRDSLESWEWEGGRVDSRTRAGGRGNGLRLSEPKGLADGLSWESFFALAYPGMKRHYVPAIAAWYRYRNNDRSWQRASVPASIASTIRTSSAI